MWEYIFKKENLIKVAAHYGITPAVGTTKSHILDLIKDHCIKNDIIDEVEEKPTAEVLKLKLEFEREERQLACEEAQKARELRLAELKETRELREHPPSDRASTFDPTRNIRLVPPLQEKEVDKYFAHFEKVADSLNWPKESRVLLLNVLVGKSQAGP